MKFQTPRGTRDFLPEEMIRRQYVLDTIRGVFEKWGFEPLCTPAFEEWSLLAAKGGGGEAVKDEIYYFKDKGDRELGLRFEFTASLCRVIVNNPAFPKPVKFYSMGPVWRYDRPGLNRYREFWQADVDIIGSASGTADALVVAVACSCLKELGFEDFMVKINNRKILQTFINSLKISDYTNILRSIDKLEKIGRDGVIAELKEKGISQNVIKNVIDFVEEKNISSIEKRLKDNGLETEAVDELKNVLKNIADLGFEKYAQFDPALVRGLDYYTGPVFEIVTKNSNTSISGGGRYDNLIERYGGKPTPATGISLGIERIVNLMEERKMFSLPKTKTKIYVACADDDSLRVAVKITEQLISLDIAAEFDTVGRALKKQLYYVNSKGIPFVIVVGQKEVKGGVVKIRDMKSGKEKKINLKNLDDVRKLLS